MMIILSRSVPNNWWIFKAVKLKLVLFTWPGPKISRLLNKAKQISGFSFEQYYLKCKLTHCNMHNQSCKSLSKALCHFGEHAWKTMFYCLNMEKIISILILFEVSMYKDMFTVLYIFDLLHLTFCVKPLFTDKKWEENKNRIVQLLSCSVKPN